jgi:hypothetical protein
MRGFGRRNEKMSFQKIKVKSGEREKEGGERLVGEERHAGEARGSRIFLERAVHTRASSGS